MDWIGLDWIHELMDLIGLGQQKWTHVQLCDRYEAASVLTTVTSQVKGLPPCQCINVRPSSVLPSSLVKPTGSFVTVFKLTMARATNVQCVMPDYSVIIIFSPSVVKIPRAKIIKLKLKT